MRIGTGMPSQDAFDLVPHHLYDFVQPAQRYSAARFVEDAREAIREICGRGHMPIVVGGTGFYIEALLGTMPLDRPPPDDALRTRLRKEGQVHPPAVLWDWLAVLRPALASRIRPNDPYRIVRGLESALAQPQEFGRHSPSSAPPVRFTVILLRVPRDILRLRIAHRVREMFAQGLVNEAQFIRAQAGEAPALSGLGYAEALALYDGLVTHREALAGAIRRTEQYAKRQDTWFRRVTGVKVVDARGEDTAVATIIALARETLSPA
jgi:tRNA dimethylallyltransferase